MSSSLTWLAYSESERRQTQEVIRRFDEPGTLDEIGVGRIRDSLAGQLFPGTSTLHTRARYFLFIPWIYRELEARSPVGRDAAQRARDREVRLINALLRQSELDGAKLPSGEPIDAVGIIGERAGKDLTQLPSEAYWNPLRIWGIRTVEGSRSACHRQLEQMDLRRPQTDEDGEPIAGAPTSWWDGQLPEAPKDFLHCTTMTLSYAEASYLRERVTMMIPDSALAQLIAVEEPLDSTDGAWDQPRAIRDQLSETNRELIRLADQFATLFHGASHLYELLVAEEAGSTGGADTVRERLETWHREVADRELELREWRDDLPRFWEVVAESNPRIPSLGERAFVESWARLALSGADLAASQEARDLIRDRERQLKRGLARLSNPSALDAWQGPTSGRRLVFRWPNAQRLITDIHHGLGIGSA